MNASSNQFWLVLTGALAILASSAGTGGTAETLPVGEPTLAVEDAFAWGATPNVRRVGRLWIAGQPDRAGLEAARQAGVEVVIDLRSPAEMSWDEAAAARALGMTYHNVPLAGKRFDPLAIARIDSLVAANAGRSIWVHCSSANRAAGWLAVHLVERKGASEQQALEIGRAAGITKDVIEASVRHYLASAGGSSPRISGPESLLAAARDAHASLAPLKQNLSATLTAALTGGPEQAVESCQLSAPGITRSAGGAGLVVGRTSHRLRNPENAPADWVEPLLEDYVSGAPTPGVGRVVDLGERGIGYVEPIYTAELCTTCHGRSVPPALRDQIEALYPLDQATGFEQGQLRGLFWVVMDRSSE